MTKKETNINKIKSPQKAEEKIAEFFMDTAYQRYPAWKTNSLNLPSPIKPAKLTNVALSNKEMANLPLGEITKSVLCGTICGDTSFAIDKGYKNARFQSRHSTRQCTWFMWKYRVILKEFTTEKGVIFQPTDGFQTSSPLIQGEGILGKLKIASGANAKLTALHQLICVNNRKTIKRSWLNHMNNYFLMTIWLDDGSLYHGYQGLICFNGIPLDQQNVFRQYLLSVWDIETVAQDTGLIMTNGQKNYRIAIANIESLLKLLRLVAPVIPVSEMLYKVYFVPKNNKSLLQRWRSELAGLVRPEFRTRVEKYYDTIEKKYP
jgi:hypothetical protein